VTKRFVTGMPGRFEVADGPSVLEGAIFEFDPASKVVSSVETVRIREPYAKS
jgi:calcineurin-like phosphoesterase